MNLENNKNGEIYGIFVNQALVQEGTYAITRDYIINFEENMKKQFGCENVEVLIEDIEDVTFDRLIRVETEDSIVFYDLRVFTKK